MKSKLLVSLIVGLLALTPGAAVYALDNPPTGVSCTIGFDGVDASWDDTLDGSEKFGGDLEATFDYAIDCEPDPDVAGTATLDVDLSRDEEDVFSYTCDGSTCSAFIDFEDLGALIDAAVADIAENECAAVNDAGWEPAAENSLMFGVKEMDPGHGKGRQNHTKTVVNCEFPPP